MLGAGGQLPVHLLLGGGQDVGEPGAGRDHVLPGGAPGLALPPQRGRVLLVTVLIAVCDLHTVSQPRDRKNWSEKNRFQKKCTTRSYLCLLWEVDGVWPGPLPLPPVAPAPHLLLPAGLLLRPRLKGGRINGGSVVFTRILAL